MSHPVESFRAVDEKTFIRGVASEDVIRVLHRIPEGKRKLVEEITMDMSNSMRKIIRFCFPNSMRTIDRFHVHKYLKINIVID